MKCAVVEDEKIHELLRNPNRVGYIVSMNPPRVGTLTFVVRLEHEHFKPDTPKNELFELVTVPWEGMQYIIATIPKEYQECADRLMKELQLRPANGVPTIFGPTGITPFPFQYPNLYNVTWVEGHPGYKGDHGAMLKKEQEEINQFFEALEHETQ